jgi:exopolyphosphatase/guanosine-5'-triphosphate,3'-diphosphate pyrophosphatase
MPNQKYTVAGVDLGSSSFRMVICRVEELDGHKQIYVIDSLREPVRLGAGLKADKTLDADSQLRAINALMRFGERLRSFSAEQVRAVATNAVRVARNAPAFLLKAEEALGFPIEVIAGQEEARLVYCGVSHLLPTGQGRRLVVDIGGGSTEFIIGEDYEPLAMESLYMGCVSWTQKFFPEGEVTAKAMKEAILSARKEVAVLRRDFFELGWTHAVGSSGTARAIAELHRANGLYEHGINKDGLQKLKDELIRSGNVNKCELQGLKPDRLGVMSGGLAVMCAVFEELELQTMTVTDGGLRQGVLYDMLGRNTGQDMREVTVARFQERYQSDRKHAGRVRELALQLQGQIEERYGKEFNMAKQRLAWACELHEVGLTVSHNGFHKHSAYIVRNSDMPGFSRPEQNVIADIVLGQTGKLAKLNDVISRPSEWLDVLCLRLATLFLRRRVPDSQAEIDLKIKNSQISVGISEAWLADHPLTDYALRIEAEEWNRSGWNFRLLMR